MATLSQHERKIPDPEDDFRRLEESYLKSLGPSLAVQRFRRRWGSEDKGAYLRCPEGLLRMAEIIPAGMPVDMKKLSS